MHGFEIGAFHEVWFVAIADEQAFYFLMTNSRQDCRVSNLVAIEVQDRQYCTIPYGVEELIGVPSCSEGTSFSFPISYDTANYQVRVIKGSPVSMRNRITQFTTFMDRARSFRGDVARNSTREGELLEQLLHPTGVLGNVGVVLAVGTFQVDVSD